MSTRKPELIEKNYTTEDYYSEAPITTRLEYPQTQEESIINKLPFVQFLQAINGVPMVAAALVVTIGMIFMGYDYFTTHGTNAEAFIAALLVGSFIWAAFKPDNSKR